MEELRRQLSENLPGSLQIFAKAMGVSTAEMTAQVESGNVLAKDVLPAFGRELQKAAAAGGALDVKLQNTMTAQGRFFNQLEMAQRKIFRGGFDEGFAKFLNTLASLIEENEQALTGIGKVFKVVFDTMTITVKAVTPVLRSFMFVMGEIAEVINNTFVNGLGFSAMIAGIGLALKKFGLLNAVLNSIAFKALMVVGVLDEIASLFTTGRVGLLEIAIGKDIDFTKTDLAKGIAEWMDTGSDWVQNLKAVITGLALVATALTVWRGTMWIFNGVVGAATAALVRFTAQLGMSGMVGGKGKGKTTPVGAVGKTGSASKTKKPVNKTINQDKGFKVNQSGRLSGAGRVAAGVGSVGARFIPVVGGVITIGSILSLIADGLRGAHISSMEKREQMKQDDPKAYYTAYGTTAAYDFSRPKQSSGVNQKIDKVEVNVTGTSNPEETARRTVQIFNEEALKNAIGGM